MQNSKGYMIVVLQFHFDQVLENDSTQDEAFEKIALPTIRGT